MILAYKEVYFLKLKKEIHVFKTKWWCLFFISAKAVVRLVRYAQSGSVWVMDNKDLFYADIPDRSLYNKHRSSRPATTSPPILVPKPQRRRSSSDARSYARISKLNVYRIKSKNIKRHSHK